MQRFNVDGVDLMHELRKAWGARIGGPIVVSGRIGPRGDGYQPGGVATRLNPLRQRG